MFMFPLELLAQWLDIVDVDAKFIHLFEAKFGMKFPFTLKTVKEHKSLESQGIAVKLTPARLAKINRVTELVGINIDFNEVYFRNEKHLMDYKTFIQGLKKNLNFDTNDSSFCIEDCIENLVEENIQFNRLLFSVRKDERKDVLLSSTLIQRFLPPEIYVRSKEYLSKLHHDAWSSERQYEEMCMMINIGMMLYIIACIDTEDLLRTSAESRPESYFSSLMPRQPFEEFNPTSAKIQMWADFAGSIRKSSNGDEDLRTTIQKWKADTERPTESKLMLWLSYIAKLKYPTFNAEQISESIKCARNHWYIALLLTNMKNCFIGKRRNTRYGIFIISNRDDLALCFERYGTYLAELKKKVGL